MNLFRRMDEEEPMVPMAPMIDIVFLLLIFFVATSIYAQLENEISITVPTAESSQTSQRGPREIVINLTREGAILVNQQRLDLEDLEHRLARISELDNGQSVIIRGDQQALFGRAIDILDVCGKCGIWRVSFAAVPEETGNAPA